MIVSDSVELNVKRGTRIEHKEVLTLTYIVLQ